ncbi:LOW QUALITY PROTEIN: phospholipid phosphatase-related protein type 2-like [Etheostoma spectabile]|uniref:LOW QUALITY PROTEIN: phospholipid phosphatase-related protein type 2-like n=1 Tax=Etheostoma spectabile TaxID=54343 RepID=UPI0013AFE477|nr:LOW QUALITY PROTEIN: phospholipid phosphatase-related protein type 2-like [Etheostoma spectabile]
MLDWDYIARARCGFTAGCSAGCIRLATRVAYIAAFGLNHTGGVYAFGLFNTTIFANAGQVVTGNQTPHFLSACRPNYTALGCQSPLQYVAERRACTGNRLLVTSARKSFPSKDAALSVYAAVYTAMYVTLVFKTKGTRLTKPTISLTLLCLAVLVGVVRVAEYRNHWADVLAGFFTGGAIAVFLVRD